MGFVSGHYLEPASAYVLKILKEKGAIKYNEHFYFDGDDEQIERVRKEMGFRDDDRRDTSDPPTIVDFAVGQLEKKGLVITEELEETMGDGEPNYTITLTEKGRAFIESGQKFKHWDMDL